MPVLLQLSDGLSVRKRPYQVFPNRPITCLARSRSEHLRLVKLTRGR